MEFGYKGQVIDNADGIVVDYEIVKGNPPDGPMLVPAITRVLRRLGRVPAAVAADRGYGEAAIDAELEALGVKRVAIPRKGKPTAARQKVQRSGWFVKLVKWRTGSEGRIAALKRNAGWGRSLMHGIEGTGIWCGWGVLAHNSFKIAALIDDRQARPVLPGHTQPTPPAATGPPTRPPPPCPVAA